MGHRLDLTNQTFGWLKAIRPAENVGRQTMWLCQCKCGKEVIVSTHNLRAQKTRSCGCMKEESGLYAQHYVEGTCIEMLKNKKARRNSKTGYKGVFPAPRGKRGWRVSIMLQGVRYNLGRFADFDEAVEARKNAEVMLHDNFIARYESGESGGAQHEAKINETRAQGRKAGRGSQP